MPVIGVAGNPADFGTLLFGPSAAFMAPPVTEDKPLAWPRRNAFTDGGGSGLTSTGGDEDDLGGATFGGEML